MTLAPVLSAVVGAASVRCQIKMISRVLDRFCQRWATSIVTTITASAAATMVKATELAVRCTPATPASTASMSVTSGGVPRLRPRR